MAPLQSVLHTLVTNQTLILEESIISEIKMSFHALKYELKKELVSVECPAHVFHTCIQHKTDTLSVGIECNTMKIYNYFATYTVRMEDIKSFFEFIDINHRQLPSHSRTRWLPLPYCGTITTDISCREIIFSPNLIHR
jgi:hypothetical protein